MVIIIVVLMVVAIMIIRINHTRSCGIRKSTPEVVEILAQERVNKIELSPFGK